MSDQAPTDLVRKTRPDEQSGLLSIYLTYILPLPLLSLAFFLTLYWTLPSPFNLIARWLSALSAGVFLALLVLLAFIAAWLKSRTAGIIVTGVILVGWLGWALFFPKAALPYLPPEASASVTALISILFPLTLSLPVLVGGLYLVAGYLLPVSEKGGARGKVFNCLVDYLSGQNYPFYVMTDEPREEDKIVQRGGGSPFSTFARGPGIILTRCDHAVAVSDGTKFKGVQGPGVIFTSFADRPMRTVDLRPQVRPFQFNALTQDGIQIEVPAAVIFQIDPGGRQPQLGEPLPYRKSAAFKAVHAQEMEPPGGGAEKVQRGWDELPQTIGMRILQDILSHYCFDDLYGPYDVEGEPPRQRIIRRFQEELRRELQPLGIHLIGGGVGNIRPVREEVLQQRVQHWQADWTRRVVLKRARGQAEWLQRIERARAEARTDLILALGERVAELEREDAGVSPEEVIFQFLEILEEWALQRGVQRYIPKGTVQGMRRLRESLEG